MAKVFKRSGSSKFYGQLRKADGTRRQTPLTTDRDTSRKLLARLQGEQDRLRALGLDDRSKRRTEPLKEHITSFREHLKSKGGTPEHIRLTISRIERVSNCLKANRISDLTSSKIQNLLASWRATGVPETRPGRKQTPLGIQSSNHYVRSLRAFSRFLWHAEITDTDVLRGLKILNARVDRRHVRRALSADELDRLIKATEARGETIKGKGWSLSGPDRAMLYRVAVYSGLRASELRSLTPESIDLDLCVIRLAASSAKNRTDAVLPLHQALVEALKPWIADRPKGQPLWGGRWNQMAASLIRRDLRLCGGSYRDEDGKVFDFHSLRSQFITGLARAGVHPAQARRLARHSSITLTMNHYTHVAVEELRDSLASVPALE